MNLAGRLTWVPFQDKKKNGKKGSYYFKVNHLRLSKIQKNIIIFKNKLNHPPTLNIASIDYSPLVQPRLKPSAIRSLIMASCKSSYERKRHPLCDSLLKSEVSSCHTELWTSAMITMKCTYERVQMVENYDLFTKLEYRYFMMV